jgi:hypothetical protein
MNANLKRLLRRMAGMLLIATGVFLIARVLLVQAHPWKEPLAAVFLWGPPQQLSPAGETAATFPVIGTGGNNVVYVAWCGQIADQYDPFYKCSTDGGHTWPASATSISPSDTRSSALDLAVDSHGGLHFAWVEILGPTAYQLYYNYNVANTTMITESQNEIVPAIAVTSDRVHVIWEDSPAIGGDRIYYSNKSLSGGTWLSAAAIAAHDSLLQYPDLVPDASGNLYAVWSQQYPVSSTIYLSKRRATDGTWLTPVELITGGGALTTSNGRPSVAVDGQNVYAVWGERVSDAEQYIDFAKSGNGGSSWTAQERIFGPVRTQVPGFVEAPRIAVDSQGRLHVVGHWTPGTYSADEIFYSYSEDGGDNWWLEPLPSEHSDSNVSRSQYEHSQTPSFVVEGTTVHVVWSEDKDSQFVYYTYGNPSLGGVYLPVILKSH